MNPATERPCPRAGRRGGRGRPARGLSPGRDAARLGPAVVRDPNQVDLPEPKPIITRFRVPIAICPGCRARIQERYPGQTSDALGAAAVQLGPRLLGLAADLKHRLGVSYCKTASLVLTLTGLVVTASALVRGGHRLRRNA